METEVRYNTRLGWLFGHLGQRAVTWNRVVHLTPRTHELTESQLAILMVHEEVHVKQQRKAGWYPFLTKYVALWVLGALKSWLWHRRRYDVSGHPLERPAYRAQVKARMAAAMKSASIPAGTPPA